MLQRSPADDQRDLRAAVFKPAIALFRALNMIPRNIQAMFFKYSRFNR
jgi:hypothetical protein